MHELKLTDADQAMLHGEAGPGTALAMRIVTGLARVSGATALLDISGAHIDGCIYHGPASLDFVHALAGTHVKVPTTLNVSSLDLLHPELIASDPPTQRAARSLMDAYEAMGARPTWTCAPYQLIDRPAFGEHIAWAESNAIVFANSVLGARTDRYGDFIDAAAALTGRAPAAGLHLDENRRPQVVFDVSGLSENLRQRDAFFAILGMIVGARSGNRVPAIVGIDTATEDQLKILGAAAASAGAVGMFHMVGVTPEAPSTVDLQQANLPSEPVTSEILVAARSKLNRAGTSPQLGSVHLGTPHYSADQLDQLQAVMAGRSPSIDLYVSAGRDTLQSWGRSEELTNLGVKIVTDTCTYVTSIIDPASGAAMTDSAKWAYYAPGNLGVVSVFGSLEECVESAIAGHVVHLDEQWS